MWEGEQSHLGERVFARNLTPDPFPCGKGNNRGFWILPSLISFPLRLLAILECDFDILRQLEILVGHAACVMRRANKRDARVVDMDVRMMVRGLRDLGD